MLEVVSHVVSQSFGQLVKMQIAEMLSVPLKAAPQIGLLYLFLITDN
jgi:hypothetical protein